MTSTPGSKLSKKSPDLRPSGIADLLSHPALNDPAAAEEFRAAVVRRVSAESLDFVAGVRAYARHSAARTPSESDVVWEKGAARLLDYGQEANDADAVMCIPSLVNRAYILDLDEDISLMRSLRAAGLRPMLLDWGDPVGEARQFTLTDYVDAVLRPALKFAADRAGKPVPVAGYCMGGNLALAAATREPDAVERLALLATPWDFHAASSVVRHGLTVSRPILETLFKTYGAAPVDLLQAMFAGLDPMLVGRKFRKFGRFDAQSAAARRFVILEDWVNDGVEVAGAVAAECLFDWYGANAPLKGAWKIADDPVDPGALNCEALVLIPSADRIVPPESAQALAGRLPDARVRPVPFGHVGMMASSKAKSAVHEPLGRWLKSGRL